MRRPRRKKDEAEEYKRKAGRKAHPGNDPNDRSYDRRHVKRLRQLDPKDEEE